MVSICSKLLNIISDVFSLILRQIFPHYLIRFDSECRHDGLFSVDCLILETILKQFYDNFWGTFTFIIWIPMYIEIFLEIYIIKEKYYVVVSKQFS